jgi:hypothetical protein
MRTISMISAAALILGATGFAVASDKDARCSGGVGVPPAASAAIRQNLEDLGYRVDRVKAAHGCWEVRAVNDSGFPIKAVYDATGTLVLAKLR